MICRYVWNINPTEHTKKKKKKRVLTILNQKRNLTCTNNICNGIYTALAAWKRN